MRQILSELKADVRGLVVSSGSDESAKIIDELRLPGTYSAASGGFTRSLYVTNEIQRFMES